MGVWEEAMRRRWAWGLATVLVIGLTASRGLARDDDDEDTSQMKPPPRPAIRWSHYFAGMESYTLPKPEPVKKPAAKSKKDTAKKAAETPKPKNPANEAASERAREEAVLMRRL